MFADDPVFSFLAEQSTESLLRLFWFTVLFEIPRYACGFISLGVAAAWAERRAARGGRLAPALRRSLSVIVVGHNEVASLERCIRSLHEQSLPPDEIIIVSDGSDDGMARAAQRLVASGRARHALATDLRSGKSAGFNLGLRACRGDIIVNVDCDCSYDRFALENVAACFVDEAVGGASGDMVPRNRGMSLVTRMQAIEYLISVSVGRRVAAGLNQVSCVSGAFAAYRRTAVEQVGGCDTGGGEDLDLTLRLRAAGWLVTFAPTAICYTDVPVRLYGLVRQRLRWERDAIRLRLRKHLRALLGGSSRGRLTEIANHWDFLVFELGATIVFPVYLIWLISRYGSLSVVVLLSVQIGLLALDLAVVSLAGLVASRPVPLSTLLYLPGFAIYSGWVMRPVRLLAFAHEWFLFGSRLDNYVPAKIRLIRKW